MTDTPRTATCPVCRQPSDTRYRPFCSRRCADIDLGRWFSGSYVVAGNDDDSRDAGTEPGAGEPSSGKGEEKD